MYFAKCQLMINYVMAEAGLMHIMTAIASMLIL
jgi:hypothetical protein